MEVCEIVRRVGRLQGRADAVEARHKNACEELDRCRQLKLDAESAQAILQAVAQETQKELEYRVSELVSLAMAAVFPDPYTLKLSFEMKRGRTEAEFLFELDGETVNPKYGSGGGVKDVAALALRLAVWSLRGGRTRPLIVLDEPFKNPSKGYRPKVAKLLKRLSRDLGLQIIMVTHDEELIEHADKVFLVKRVRKVSHVEIA